MVYQYINPSLQRDLTAQLLTLESDPNVETHIACTMVVVMPFVVNSRSKTRARVVRSDFTCDTCSTMEVNKHRSRESNFRQTELFTLIGRLALPALELLRWVDMKGELSVLRCATGIID